MKTWALRPAEARDLDGMVACIRAAYAEDAARIDDLPAVADGLDRDLRDHIVRVAEAGGQVVGVLVLVAHRDHMKLANVAVRPEAGRQGVGGALLAEAERLARGLGLGEMRLVTHRRMERNVALYTRRGWRVTGCRGNAVLMAKTV